MTKPSSLFRATLGLLVAGLTLGCSTPVPARAPAPETARYELAGVEASMLKQHAALLQDLDLSVSQVQALRRVAHGTIAATAPMMAISHALLTGHPSGFSALGQGLTTLLRLDAEQDANTLEAIRAVLTPAQREKLARALLRFPAIHEAVIARLFQTLRAGAADELLLSSGQRSKLGQCMAEMKRFWDANREAYVGAMAAHLVAGDRASLQQAFAGLASKLDTAPTAAFLESLDAHQRRTLAARLERARNRVAHGLARFLSRGAGSVRVAR